MLQKGAVPSQRAVRARPPGANAAWLGCEYPWTVLTVHASPGVSLSVARDIGFPRLGEPRPHAPAPPCMASVSAHVQCGGACLSAAGRLRSPREQLALGLGLKSCRGCQLT